MLEHINFAKQLRIFFSKFVFCKTYFNLIFHTFHIYQLFNNF